MRYINVIKKMHSTSMFLYEYGFEGMKILNAGSSNTDYGGINIDIQNKAGIHFVSDVHDLPFSDSSFDIVVLTAVLQYCLSPHRVSFEIHRVLKPGGYVYVDAPFVQPYCIDTPDLFRFTKDGLISVFNKEFTVLECNASIPTGSALAYYLQSLCGNLNNRYISYALNIILSIIVLPLTLIKSCNTNVAGALYLIGKKKSNLGFQHH